MGEVICHDGMLLRWGGEQTVRPLRAILYLLLLGWCFMGVAIIADVFMVAIEKITSKKRRVWSEDKHRLVTITVWNPTVANLTLMALGSSAPEILLNVLENFRDNFFNGKEGETPLGPSTIVGSAAFNLLIIVGVCIVVIPDGEIRAIKDMSVHITTAACSIFAYIWLLIILTWRTPHAVEPWEGVLTFLFFPALVFVAWRADVSTSSEEPRGLGVLAAEMTKEELAELESQVRKEHGLDLTEDQVAKFLSVMCGEGSSRAKYRIAATRALSGGKRVKFSQQVIDKSINGLARLARTVSTSKKSMVVPLEPGPRGKHGSISDAMTTTVVEFAEIKKAVLESASSLSISIVRSGDLSIPCRVDYKTRDGTAKAPSDYVEAQGTLIFDAGEVRKNIEVKIVDDFSYEENEEFYVDLHNENVAGGEDVLGHCILGSKKSITVVIVDDDLPGIISFKEEELKVREAYKAYEVSVPVLRKNGGTGKVSCTYRTEDASGIAGRDYEATEGTLEFAHQEMQSSINIKIFPRGRYDRSDHFRLILEGPVTGGAKFDHHSDGGADCCILTVLIEGGAVAKERVDRLMSNLQVRWEKAKVGHSNWRDQFVAALYVNGGDDDDDDEGPPGVLDYAMHIIAVPWKVLFAFCPPTDYCGGWLTFVVALIFIGFVTALIDDLANYFGCVLDICSAITAITFVALGTSLPDTFASKTAAMQDPYADASIVNVTGSNSVNVFLGLGLPWMLSSIKWWISGRNDEWDRRYLLDEDLSPEIRRDGAFIVKAGSLGFSVGIFTAFAVICIALLAFRRVKYGGELGGPWVAKWLSSALLVCLWAAYIGLSSWQALEDGC